jgi:hypothetical protein
VGPDIDEPFPMFDSGSDSGYPVSDSAYSISDIYSILDSGWRWSHPVYPGLNVGNGLSINSQTRPLHTNEGTQNDTQRH